MAIQLGLNFQQPIRGSFTVERPLIGHNLVEIERMLGYQAGRLKQGADFYILDPPSSIQQFEIMGTTAIPEHHFRNSQMEAALNTDEVKEAHLSFFKTSVEATLMKVVPLQIHVEAMARYLSFEDYQLLKHWDRPGGLSRRQYLENIAREQGRHHPLYAQVERLFNEVADIFKENQDVNDHLYPSAGHRSVLAWKTKGSWSLPGRLVCRMTDYRRDLYQRS